MRTSSVLGILLSTLYILYHLILIATNESKGIIIPILQMSQLRPLERLSNLPKGTQTESPLPILGRGWEKLPGKFPVMLGDISKA